ncbi:YraN family protein [Paenibacillus sp. GCM10023252]|uniref:YraN family protein n=1 Tax=Paenibacillus sp. GCM10023252 TaxID=3252649 RepID=UPI003617DEE0
MSSAAEGGSTRPSSGSRRQTVGRVGEEAAAAYLLESGHRIVERNWRCRTGELDIIAEYGEILIIVEVRARRAGGRFGTAAESVDARKQLQVRLTSEVYRRGVRASDRSVRFDVITVLMDYQLSILELRHIEGAF